MRLSWALAIFITSGCTTAGSNAPLVAASLRSSLSDTSQAALVHAPVPLLLPSDPALLRAAIVTTGERWAAVSIPQSDITISLHATDAFHEAPDGVVLPLESYRVRGTAARTTVNEGIRSIAWQERGVAYSLEVECQSPERDVRCTEDAFARSLVESLVFVGGGAK